MAKGPQGKRDRPTIPQQWRTYLAQAELLCLHFEESLVQPENVLVMFASDVEGSSSGVSVYSLEGDPMLLCCNDTVADALSIDSVLATGIGGVLCALRVRTPDPPCRAVTVRQVLSFKPQFRCREVATWSTGLILSGTLRFLTFLAPSMIVHMPTSTIEFLFRGRWRCIRFGKGILKYD